MFKIFIFYCHSCKQVLKLETTKFSITFCSKVFRSASSSDASDFNKLEKLDFLAKIEVGNSHIVLGRIEIASISPAFILYAMLASELLDRSENIRIESCSGFSCLQF